MLPVQVKENVNIIVIKIMAMMILMMKIIIVIIIAIMVMMIKIILMIAVVIVINSPFQPGDFSTDPPLENRLVPISNSKNERAKSSYALFFLPFFILRPI